MPPSSCLCTSLTSIRYALDQGAAAIAVDIEDVNPRIEDEKFSTKISLHQVQRRKVDGLLEGEPMGNI
jgi:molybdenum cofactor sulfurtransferase